MPSGGFAGAGDDSPAGAVALGHGVPPGAARSAALIDNSIDPPANIVGNVERAVRPDCEARGTMRSAFRRLHRSRKTVRENFAIAGCRSPESG